MALVIPGKEKRTFAKKTLKTRHSDKFVLNPNKYNIRKREEFQSHIGITTRCYKSPLNYLTRLLNRLEPYI